MPWAVRTPACDRSTDQFGEWPSRSAPLGLVSAARGSNPERLPSELALRGNTSTGGSDRSLSNGPRNVTPAPDALHEPPSALRLHQPTLLRARQNAIPPHVWTRPRLQLQPTVVARRQGAYPPPYPGALPPPAPLLTATSPTGSSLHSRLRLLHACMGLGLRPSPDRASWQTASNAAEVKGDRHWQLRPCNILHEPLQASARSCRAAWGPYQ